MRKLPVHGAVYLLYFSCTSTTFIVEAVLDPDYSGYDYFRFTNVKDEVKLSISSCGIQLDKKGKFHQT